VKHFEFVLPQIRRHLAFRLENHLGTLTLVNMSNLPIAIVRLEIAVWCILSLISFIDSIAVPSLNDGFREKFESQLLKLRVQSDGGHLRL
jgi:hypothetical protein